jgi:Tfp pilus assembly protein PilF
MFAAALTFNAATGYDFIWDDPLVLQQIDQMRSIGDVLAPPEVVPKFYYRPVVFLTFLLDQAFGRGQAYWFHLTVVAWHTLVTGLVYLLARQLLGRRFFVEAGVAALLFAVHPVHVESVAWIAGRSDVIATAFVVLALLVGRAESSWSGWAAGACLLFGMLSKEVAVSGLVLLPARDWFVDRKLRWQRYLPLVVALGVYLAMRRFGLGRVDTGLATGTGIGENIYAVLCALGWYVAKMPVPFYSGAFVPEIPMSPFYASAGFALLAATFAAAVVGRPRVVAFLLLWFVVTLAPSLLVIVRRSASAVLAERYLYLPSVGAVILVAWALVALRSVSARGWQIAVALFIPVAMLAGMESAQRSDVWANDLTFWSDVAAQTPNHSMPRRELANAYMKRQKLDEAEKELQAALALPSNPQDRVMTYNNLGNIFLRRGDLDAAASAFEAGAALYPHNYVFNGLGRTAMRRAERAQERGDQAVVVQQVKAASRFLQQALARDPNDYKSHVLLGQVLFSLHDRAGARQHLETALRIESRGAVADTARQYLQQLNAGG